MKTRNIAEARSEFSALVEEIRLGGEDVVISKYGRPVAMIVPFRPQGGKESRKRDWRAELGLRNSCFTFDPRFDEPMDNLWEVFGDDDGGLSHDSSGHARLALVDRSSRNSFPDSARSP